MLGRLDAGLNDVCTQRHARFLLEHAGQIIRVEVDEFSQARTRQLIPVMAMNIMLNLLHHGMRMVGVGMIFSLPC